VADVLGSHIFDIYGIVLRMHNNQPQ